MSSEGTAQRYAEALFGIGKDSGKIAVFQKNAEDFLGILEKSRDLVIALSHPNIRRIERKAVIDQILEKCTYDRDFSNFVRLVVERGRVSEFSKIVSCYTSLCDASDGRLRGNVFVAEPMKPTQLARIREKLQQKLGRDVILKECIEPSVIAGFRIEIDGRVYDSSVQRHLDRLRESMLHQA